MAEQTRFTVAFEGEAVDQNLMEVGDLAPALLGLADVIDEINVLVTRGEARIVLHVRAGFRPGSFTIDFELAQAAYRKFVEVFTSPSATAWATFLTLLGISGGFGLIQLLKRSKGRKPKSVVEIERTNRIRVTFEGDEPIELEQRLWRLFNSPKARSGMNLFTKPLRREGVDRIRLKKPDANPVVVERDDADSFKIPTEHEGELVTESERVLHIIGLSFKEGNKWRVSEGANTYYVSIQDADFNQRVAQGHEGFRANDFLRVVLRTRQWYEGPHLKASYEVIKILEHIRGLDSEAQLDLNPDANNGGV